MEIRNPKKEVVWVVRTTFLILITIMWTACAMNAPVHKNKNIERWESKEGNTFLNLSSFQGRDTLMEFPATYHINNLIFPPRNVGNLVLPVMPGTFSITAGGISKEWTTIKPIKVHKGDSLVVRIFLEDDTEPLFN